MPDSQNTSRDVPLIIAKSFGSGLIQDPLIVPCSCVDDNWLCVLTVVVVAAVGVANDCDNVTLVVVVTVVVNDPISQNSPPKPSSQMQRPNKHSFPF